MSGATTPRTAIESDLDEALEEKLAFRRRRHETLGDGPSAAICSRCRRGRVGDSRAGAP